MVTASILINQSGRPAGQPGVSRDDLVLSQIITLTNHDNAEVVSWNWQLLSKPAGSLSSLVGSTSGSCQFTPDVAGSYLIQLHLNGRVRATAVAAIKTTYLGLRIPAVGETSELGGWETGLQAIVSQLEFGIEAGGGGAVHHHLTHQSGGLDEINVAGLTGLLATAQTPAVHNTSHQSGGLDEINVAGLTGLLATAQTPAVHNASHQNGGSDEISVTGLDGYLAQPQNTDRLQSRAVSASAPSDGDSLVWDASVTRWRPKTITGGSSSSLLLMADDTEFTEATTAYVEKRSFRITQDSTAPWTGFRVGCSIWKDGDRTSGDVRVTFTGAGSINVDLSSTEIVDGNNALKFGTGAWAETGTQIITVSIQLKATGGTTGNGHYKLIEIYGTRG